MNPFVEECRREWKRLGVPDPVANEMAADLEADLAEAEADGTSAEEVLGTGAFDAPAFAAAWAAERGVVPPPTPSGTTRVRRSRAPYVIAGFAALNLDLGRWVWWPSKLYRHSVPETEQLEDQPAAVP